MELIIKEEVIQHWTSELTNLSSVSYSYVFLFIIIIIVAVVLLLFLLLLLVFRLCLNWDRTRQDVHEEAWVSVP